MQGNTWIPAFVLFTGLCNTSKIHNSIKTLSPEHRKPRTF